MTAIPRERAAGSSIARPTAAQDIRVAHSSHENVDAALDEVRAIIGVDAALELLLVFASPRYDPNALAAGLAARFPGVPHAGGTTAGEIGPDGLAEDSLVVVALPADGFVAVSALLPDLPDMTVERSADIVLPLLGRLAVRTTGVPAERGWATFAMTFLDGMCRREEVVVAALQRCLDNVPLVGGSCGDALAFNGTYVFHDGRAEAKAGVLVLITTDRPFELIRHDNFEPTGMKLVVTECDSDLRKVYEFNAEPAARAYAEAAGLDPLSLSPMSFASHPVLVRVGGEYYSRSIQKLNDDGSLSFFCAIDTGVVLTAARPVDLVESLSRALQGAEQAVGGIDVLIGFDCVLRKLDAENRQVIRQVSDLYAKHRVAGFHTYGEQYRAMHLNQTFTGVAIGRREASA